MAFFTGHCPCSTKIANSGHADFVSDSVHSLYEPFFRFAYGLLMRLCRRKHPHLPMPATFDTFVARFVPDERTLADYTTPTLISGTTLVCVILALVYLCRNGETRRPRHSIPAGPTASSFTADRPPIRRYEPRRGRPQRVFSVVGGQEYGFWTDDTELPPGYPLELIQTMEPRGYRPGSSRDFPPPPYGA